MRCPHCAGEILDGSRFCGICGRQCAAPAAPLTLPPDGRVSAGDIARGSQGSGGLSSLSLFELPVSRGARVIRILAVLALDAALVVAGIAMMVSYMNDRDRAGAPTTAADAGVAAVRVEASTPTLVKSDSDRESSAENESRSRSTSGSATSSGGASGSRGSATSGSHGSGTSGSSGSGSSSGGGTSGSTGTGGGTPDPDPGDPGTRSRHGRSVRSASSTGADGGAAESSAEATDEQIEVVARQIALLVNRHNGRLERCYSQSAKAFSADDPLVGTVEIQFMLVRGGTVENVKTVRNSTGSSELADCVVGLVKSWSFPEPPGSASLPFAWPFNFKAP